MRKNPYTGIFIKSFLITIIIGVILFSTVGICAVFGMFGNVDSLNISTLTMDYSSQIYYTDSNGDETVLTTLSSEQNRVWVDFEDIPDYLKEAIVAIEDERFYSHRGVDPLRTTKAFFVFVKNKITRQPTTFGGSTITQQLVKNLTQNTDRTAARKIKEISQAVNLEKQISKDKILELYLNSIYLSQGCNGVQTASRKFFGKSVSELDLAECASIAGITQYPTLYDPLVHPDKNKEKQEVVLKKMLELGKISQEEYDSAVSEKLEFHESDVNETGDSSVNSYFVDQLIYDITDELIEKGYTKALASKMIYSGGLKITATIDPKIQDIMETVYENTDNFPFSTGDVHAQSAMVVMDPYTGGIKGIVGGIGKKDGSLVLNRASQTLRQPGSTIKPIAVYAPAFDSKLIKASDIYTDKAINYNGWTPRNYDYKYRGNVTVRYALRQSLNTIPVQILNKLGVNKSFRFLTNDLGVTSLVSSMEGKDGKIYSDIGLSQLALGGLTNGISVTELTAAYTPFVNRGIYTKPYSFTEVLDADGNELLSHEPESDIAMSEQTAYIMSMLLHEVVTSGTGTAARLPSGMFAAGKTGTTSDNNDRWFVGYTQNYVAGVWYGYDQPQTIKARSNPCIPVWKNIMSQINAGLPNKTPTKPSGIVSASYCAETGLAAGSHCTAVESFWFTNDNKPSRVCSSKHASAEDETATEESGEKSENGTGENIGSEPSDSTPTGTAAPGTDAAAGGSSGAGSTGSAAAAQ